MKFGKWVDYEPEELIKFRRTLWLGLGLRFGLAHLQLADNNVVVYALCW